MENSKWIESLKVRTTDTGWIPVIIMIYGCGIGFILHCLQRRTLTPFIYVSLSSIVSPILYPIFESLYIETDFEYFDIGPGLTLLVQLVIATLVGKLAIRHDRLVALELLNDRNINERIFSSSLLIQKSFTFLQKDIKFLFKK